MLTATGTIDRLRAEDVPRDSLHVGIQVNRVDDADVLEPVGHLHERSADVLERLAVVLAPVRRDQDDAAARGEARHGGARVSERARSHV